jgi:hypothetical protein
LNGLFIACPPQPFAIRAIFDPVSEGKAIRGWNCKAKQLIGVHSRSGRNRYGLYFAFGLFCRRVI